MPRRSRPNSGGGPRYEAARHRRRRDARPRGRRARDAARPRGARRRVAPSSTSPTRGDVAGAAARRARRRSSTARPTPTSTAPSPTGAAPRSSTPTGPATSPRPPREVGASDRPPLDGLRLRRLQARAVARIRPRRAARRLRRDEARRRASGRGGQRRTTRSCARRGCSAPAGGTSSTRCSRLGAQRDEVSVVTDQVGCPTWTGHLAGALVELAERPQDTGIHHIAGGGAVLVERVRARDLRASGHRLPRAADDERAVRARRRGGPRTACSAASAATRSCCRPGSDGLADYLATRVAAT